jgi:hypothetical protein
MGRKRKIALIGGAAFQQQAVPPYLTEDERHKFASAAEVSFSVDDWTEINRIRHTYIIYKLVEKLGIGYTSATGPDGVQNRIAKLRMSLRKHDASSALQHLFHDEAGLAVWNWLNSVHGRQYNRLLDAKTIFVILSAPEHHELLNVMDGLLQLTTVASQEMQRAHEGAREVSGSKNGQWGLSTRP